jgi:CRISPR system Cascade subunit CasD
VTALLLRLGAPLQSWGTSSRFVRRNTDRSPSKSGIIGLLAAAKGLRRTDPLEELLRLRIGVRVEQPGQVERDFQTARTRDGSSSMPLSYRFYLADAVFLVAIEGEAQLLDGLREALRHPVFPLFLGRRSCPPAGRLEHGLRNGGVEQALDAEPWLASPWVQRSHRAAQAVLDTVVDCAPGAPGSDLVRDEPTNFAFDPRKREYGWRSVRHGRVTVANPMHRSVPSEVSSPQDPHDPMAAFGGVR